MQSFLSAINTVGPIIIIILLGFFLRKIKVIDEIFTKGVDKVVFWVFLPVMLFNTMATSEIGEMIDAKIFLLMPILVIVYTLVLCFVVPKFEKDKTKIPVIIQAIFRFDNLIYAIPVGAALFGNEALKVVATTSLIIMPLLNVVAVIVLSYFTGSSVDVKGLIKRIVTNPFIIGACLGMIVMLLRVKLPTMILKTSGELSDVAIPLALISLGGQLNFTSVKKNIKLNMIVVVGRLIIPPIVSVLIAYFLGASVAEMFTIMLTVGASTSTGGPAMASQMGADSKLAGEFVVMTAFFSMFTIFLFVFIMNMIFI